MLGTQSPRPWGWYRRAALVRSNMIRFVHCQVKWLQCVSRNERLWKKTTLKNSYVQFVLTLSSTTVQRITVWEGSKSSEDKVPLIMAVEAWILLPRLESQVCHLLAVYNQTNFMNYVCIFLIYTNDTHLMELPWGQSALINRKPFKECLPQSKCLITLVIISSAVSSNVL